MDLGPGLTTSVAIFLMIEISNLVDLSYPAFFLVHDILNIFLEKHSDISLFFKHFITHSHLHPQKRTGHTQLFSLWVFVLIMILYFLKLLICVVASLTFM